jgi:predicted TIM-barrel fold metal-dependent hydrolase
VDAAVLHRPSWDPNSDELAVEAARAHPNRLAVLGKFAIDRPESRQLIDGWKKRPGMLGLRFALLQPHQRAWWSDGTMDWLWPAAERAQIPIALLAGEFLPAVANVAERHPGLKLAIDHLGRVGRTRDEPAFANIDELLALARYPNISVKATGAPSYSSETYPYRNIHPFLRQIYDAFGPERMFWGTDITRMPCSWRQCVTLFTQELDFLSPADKELIMGRAVCNWLGWALA